jgi:hypothetical protein
MRVDDVEPLRPTQLLAAYKSHWQIRKHRRKICNRELPPKEDGHAQHAHRAVVVLCSQITCLRGYNGDLVSTGEVSRQRCHDNATTATQGRIFVITKKDAHGEELARMMPKEVSRGQRTGGPR